MISAGSLITRNPVTVKPDASILEGVRLMSAEKVGVVILRDPNHDIVGIVSERDVIQSIAGGKDLNEPLENIASKSVISVKDSDDVGAAARTMADKKIRHLIVLDDSGDLSGVISIRDLVGERSTLRAIAESYGEEPPTGGD
ncbi:MAG: CBS domain-containing protein [Nitrososphaerales archaeon]